jgi:pilus assembly protein Flp/PilA
MCLLLLLSFLPGGAKRSWSVGHDNVHYSVINSPKLNWKKELKIMTYLKNFINDEEGQDLVEYALLLGFVALACVTILTTLGGSIGSFFTATNTKVTAAKSAIS